MSECVFVLSLLAVAAAVAADDCFCAGFGVQGVLMFLLLAVAVWILLLLLVEVVVHGYVTFLATGAMMGTERGTDGCCFCGGDDTVDVANSFSATGAGAAGLGVLAATGAPDTPDVAGLGSLQRSTLFRSKREDLEQRQVCRNSEEN